MLKKTFRSLIYIEGQIDLSIRSFNNMNIKKDANALLKETFLILPLTSNT